MTGTQSVKLYRLFQRLTQNDAEAEMFVQEVEAVVDDRLEQKKDVLATKADLELLRTATKADLDSLGTATRADLESLRTATKADLDLVKQDIRRLDVRLSDTKADLIKWMFIFWAGNVVTTLGALYGFLKAFSAPH